MPVLFLRRKSIYSLPVILCLVLSFLLLSSNAFANADFDNALALYRQLEQEPFSEAKIARYDEVISLLDKVLTVESFSSSDASNAAFMKFRSLEQQAKYPEARAMYGNYLDRLEAGGGTDYAVLAVRRMADYYFFEKDLPSAVNYYDLLIEKYPHHPRVAYAYLMKGLAAQDDRFLTEAAADFQKVIRDYPDSIWTPEAYRKLAYNLLIEEKYEESLAMLDELSSKYPDTKWPAYAQMRRGFTYEWQEKYPEALAEYAEFMERFPKSHYVPMVKEAMENVRKKLEEQVFEGIVKKPLEKEHQAAEEKSPAPLSSASAGEGAS